ncbi:hypothetical protein J2Z38_001620 [Anaerococcus degeneri]|nr:hypothetical protein [Anaerococcus degeneri]
MILFEKIGFVHIEGNIRIGGADPLIVIKQ